MKKGEYWLREFKNFDASVRQARDEGRDLSSLEAQIASAKAIPDEDERLLAFAELEDRIMELPIRGGYGYDEPSDVEGIRALRSGFSPDKKLSPETERIYGAWLGRICGCLLGQPVEGWRTEKIHGFLAETGNFPLTYYMSSDQPEDIRRRYGVSDEPGDYHNEKKSWINNIKNGPEDDDTNYSVLALQIMERFGRGFTRDNMAWMWQAFLPYKLTFTAERATYRNLVLGISPAETAEYRNPGRELIGAQIRGDVFGYVCPGQPEKAAAIAWNDGALSHVKNGIYGEMWVAASLAAAPLCAGTREAMEAGLAQIPATSRLYGALKGYFAMYDAGSTWDDMIKKLRSEWDESDGYDWCHTISNACIVALALLCGGDDFTKVMDYAIRPGFDTDCNAATAGSIFGMVFGRAGIPERWYAPLNDTLLSTIGGEGYQKIADLVRRTEALAQRED